MSIKNQDPEYFFKRAMDHKDNVNIYFTSLTQAANLGHKKAEKLLCEEYENQRDRDQVFDEALLEYYKWSADQGYTWSENYLGLMYSCGKCVEQNYDKAVEYFKKAAEKGNSYALFNLGLAFEKGNGFEKDGIAAMAFYELSIQLGNPYAMNSLGLIYMAMSTVSLKEGFHEKAIELFEKAIKKNNTGAMINLGSMYQIGIGVEPNKDKAFELYKQAFEHNCKPGKEFEELTTVEEKVAKLYELTEFSVKKFKDDFNKN